MSETGKAAATCPACGKKYRWTAELAGRKIRCACGVVMRMPSAPGPGIAVQDGSTVLSAADASSVTVPTGQPANPENYELSDPDAALPPGPSAAKLPPPPTDRCPNCGQKMSKGAAICLNCGFDRRSGKKLATAINPADAQSAGGDGDAAPPAEGRRPAALPKRSTASLTTAYSSMTEIQRKRMEDNEVQQRKMARAYYIKDFLVPLIMLPFGVLMTIAGSFFLASIHYAGNHPLLHGLIITVEVAVAQVVVMIPILLVGIIVAARVLQIGFGSLWTALLKIAAISLGPGAIGDLILALIWPFLVFSIYSTVAVMVVLGLIFIGMPMMFMFDLDFNETLNSVMIIVIVRIVALFIFVFGILPMFL